MLKQCPFCMVDLLVIKPHTFSPMGIVAVKVTMDRQCPTCKLLFPSKGRKVNN